MKNLELGQDILTKIFAEGVREVVVCAGARNAPFVQLLSGNSPFRIYSFFEERSAAFFALGRMQDTRRPVAIVTTSGTAAAELLPACIEADHQGLPLVMITADRPRRYRGSGAPQTIIQPGLFSHYTGAQYDIEGEVAALTLSARPTHINVCLDEPLLDGQVSEWKLEERARPREARARQATLDLKRPLVIVGGLNREEVSLVEPLLAQWRRPLYLEGPSRLRGAPALAGFEIRGSEKTIKHLNIDGVIRIGSVPTLRFWRDLELSALPVHCFSNLPYSGLPRVSEISPLSALPENPKFEYWDAREAQKDQDLAHRREVLLKEFPLSEPAWIEWLSRQMSENARVFLGNSLPVREWDFAAAAQAPRDIFVNRGTNGIDGLISTFAGVSQLRGDNWAVLGDLSTMYDLSGPWALKMRPLEKFNLVVINNGGGQIFHRMFRNPLFLNSHDLRFGDWAKMWDLDYAALREPMRIQSGRQVIEILPDATQTEAFWKAWEVTT